MLYPSVAYLILDPERLAKRKGQREGYDKKVSLEEMEGNTFFLCFLTKIPHYTAWLHRATIQDPSPLPGKATLRKNGNILLL